MVSTDAEVASPEGTAGTAGSSTHRAAACVVLLVCATVSIKPEVAYVHTVPMTLALVVALWLLGRRTADRLSVRADRVSLVAAVALLVLGAGDVVVALAFRVLPDQPAWVHDLMIAAYAVTAVLAALQDRWFVPFLVAQGAAFVALIRSGKPLDDVYVTLDGSIRALLHGHNPYALTFPNPYDAAQTAQYFSPGVIVDGRIAHGFGYLPVVLVGETPGYLLGDLRYASALALLATAYVARRLARDQVGRLLSMSIVASPLALFVVYRYWVEPVIALLLALTVWALYAGRGRLGPAGFGLLLASKQYFVVTLPLLRTLRRMHGTRAVLTALGVAALVVVPFALLDVHAFVGAVVSQQLHKPFRTDSTSLAVDLARTFGRPPDWVFGLAAFGAAFATSWWVDRRGPATATTLVRGVGYSLLALVLMSKEAFPNYYLLIAAAVALAAVLDTRADRSGQQD